MRADEKRISRRTYTYFVKNYLMHLFQGRPATKCFNSYSMVKALLTRQENDQYLHQVPQLSAT